MIPFTLPSAAQALPGGDAIPEIQRYDYAVRAGPPPCAEPPDTVFGDKSTAVNDSVAVKAR
jgi:hypothetical protein